MPAVPDRNDLLRQLGDDRILAHQTLFKALHYDSDTGVFTWLIRPSQNMKVGDTAGYKEPTGYWVIALEKRYYKAHRLAWLYMTGEFPNKQIDHINRVRHDNRWRNLRLATQSENNANAKTRANSSGVKGVVFDKATGLWMARIRHNYRLIHLGRYASLEEASWVRDAKAKELFGEFAW